MCVFIYIYVCVFTKLCTDSAKRFTHFSPSPIIARAHKLLSSARLPYGSATSSQQIQHALQLCHFLLRFLQVLGHARMIFK